MPFSKRNQNQASSSLSSSSFFFFSSSVPLCVWKLWKRNLIFIEYSVLFFFFFKNEIANGVASWNTEVWGCEGGVEESCCPGVWGDRVSFNHPARGCPGPSHPHSPLLGLSFPMYSQGSGWTTPPLRPLLSLPGHSSMNSFYCNSSPGLPPLPLPLPPGDLWSVKHHLLLFDFVRFCI